MKSKIVFSLNGNIGIVFWEVRLILAGQTSVRVTAVSHYGFLPTPSSRRIHTSSTPPLGHSLSPILTMSASSLIHRFFTLLPLLGFPFPVEKEALIVRGKIGNRHSSAFHVSREKGTFIPTVTEVRSPTVGRRHPAFHSVTLFATFPQEQWLTRLVRVQATQRAEFLSALGAWVHEVCYMFLNCVLVSQEVCPQTWQEAYSGRE